MVQGTGKAGGEGSVFIAVAPPLIEGGGGGGGSPLPGSPVGDSVAIGPGGDAVGRRDYGAVAVTFLRAPGVAGLGEAERNALASLLDAAQRLTNLACSKRLKACELEAQLIATCADRVATEACRLAGLDVEIGPAEGELVLLSLEIERNAERSWSTHVEARSEKAVGHYIDAPTRSTSIALGLVSLARTVLVCDATNSAGEHRLEELLGEAMHLYDEHLSDDTPELSCHGEHVD